MIIVKTLMAMMFCSALVIIVYVFVLVNKEIDDAWEKFRKGKS